MIKPDSGLSNIGNLVTSVRMVAVSWCWSIVNGMSRTSVSLLMGTKVADIAVFDFKHYRHQFINGTYLMRKKFKA